MQHFGAVLILLSFRYFPSHIYHKHFVSKSSTTC